MKQENLKIKNYVVKDNDTIKDAMSSINDNRKGTVMVCDNNFHLIGVLSDGEIRRALTSGKNILSPIKEIININPVFIKNEFNYQKTAKDIFRKKNNINMLPVIDGDNKLIDVIIRDCKS